jgi:hypothetical protein
VRRRQGARPLSPSTLRTHSRRRAFPLLGARRRPLGVIRIVVPLALAVVQSERRVAVVVVPVVVVVVVIVFPAVDAPVGVPGLRLGLLPRRRATLRSGCRGRTGDAKVKGVKRRWRVGVSGGRGWPGEGGEEVVEVVDDEVGEGVDDDEVDRGLRAPESDDADGDETGGSPRRRRTGRTLVSWWIRSSTASASAPWSMRSRVPRPEAEGGRSG